MAITCMTVQRPNERSKRGEDRGKILRTEEVWGYITCKPMIDNTALMLLALCTVRCRGTPNSGAAVCPTYNRE
jgi:hypothetical protein